jgi:hypothetical protein
MKKILLTTIVVLLAVALNAQVSVWDGSYEMWDTIHAGTEDDPILIENAAQFAYMSNFHFCGQQLKYWKLTTDIDLDNRNWNPIGNNGSSCPEFDGYFDGDNHTIYHLTTNLFVCCNDGYIKNLVIKESDVLVQSSDLYHFGLITSSAPLIENCHSYANITINGNHYTVGGIVSECYTMINCSNHGEITIVSNSLNNIYVGGVVSMCYDVIDCCNYGTITVFSPKKQNFFVGGVVGQATNVESSYNYGDINLNIIFFLNGNIGGVAGDANMVLSSYNHGMITINADVTSTGSHIGGVAGSSVAAEMSYNAGSITLITNYAEQANYIGGICGSMKERVLQCYNRAEILEYYLGSKSRCGGIVGEICISDSVSQVLIKSCYNTGEIDADNVGGIVGKNSHGADNLIIENCYYTDAIVSYNDYGTPKSEDEMKSEDFVSLLNTDEEMFFMDTYGYLNDGFPILKWQHESHVGVDETDWQGNVAVYPNPVQSVLTVSGENLKELEVINILGQPVLKTPCSGESVIIDLAGQPAGVYFIKITDKDGNKYSEKVVKE